MRIKESLNDIIGKIVSGIVVANSQGDHPRSNIYFVFSDGTAFEFWGDQRGISMASILKNQGLDQLIENLEKNPDNQIEVVRAPHENPDAIQRDMLTDDST